MSAKRENVGNGFRKAARLRRVAGGASAVPANHLTGDEQSEAAYNALAAFVSARTVAIVFKRKSLLKGLDT